MKPDELHKLEEDLLAEKKEIMEELAKIAHENPLIKEDYQTNMASSDPSDSSDDKAQKVTDYERDRAVEQRLELRLRDINHTLNQIKAGSYGSCTKCKGEIPAQRLHVMPTATTCVNCAQKANLI